MTTHFINVAEAFEKLFERRYNSLGFFSADSVEPTLVNLSQIKCAPILKANIVAEVMLYGTEAEQAQIQKQFKPEEINNFVNFAKETLAAKAAHVNANKVHHATGDTLEAEGTLGLDEEVSFNNRHGMRP